MKLNINCKTEVEVDIDSEEAFRILVKSLCMDFILEDNHEYFTHNNWEDEMCVYEKDRNGCEILIDDRGDLYNGLMAVAKCIFPNI